MLDCEAKPLCEMVMSDCMAIPISLTIAPVWLGDIYETWVYCGCDISNIVSVHIQCQTSIYILSLRRGHSLRVWLAKQETLTPPGHLVSSLVYRGP